MVKGIVVVGGAIALIALILAGGLLLYWLSSKFLTLYKHKRRQKLIDDLEQSTKPKQ